MPGGAYVARSISGRLATNRSEYAHVAATQDHHIDPGDHFSDHPDYAHSWPPHCVAGTPGAEFHPDLDTSRVETIFRKGAHAAAYSGFEGADDTGTLLGDWLRERGVTELDIAGIATDHCVRATAVDGARGGFATRVLLSLTAGVAPDSTARALSELRDDGVELTRDARSAFLAPRSRQAEPGRQFTQGMPFSAPTAPPCGPVVGMTDDGEADGALDGLAVGAVKVGTAEVSAPIRTSMWFVATVALAADMAPNAAAIWLALAASPVP